MIPQEGTDLITIDETRERIRKAVEERGRDFVYPEEMAGTLHHRR